MKTGGIVGLIVVALVVIIGIFIFVFSGNQEAQTGQEPEEQQPSITIGVEEGVNEPTSKTVTVEITSSGFSPRTMEINSGDTVMWTNLDSRSHWPASAVHPTHTVYPGSSINKCGGSDEGSTFDACSGVRAGGSYSFTFNEKGSWGYHDHLRSSLTGTIVVN